MPDFIEVIPIANKRYYFSFRKKEIDTNVKYYVVTIDGEDSISFEMREQEKGVWKIKGSAPDWIKKIEDKLGDAISIRQKLNI